MPKVSVITPCFDYEGFIGRTIESVRAQTFDDWELIIVDDGSPGDLPAVVAPFSEADARIRLTRQPHGQVSKARNRGFAAACPESTYLLFLDADDCLEPEMIAIMVEYLDSQLEVGMAHCGKVDIDEYDELMPAARQRPDVRYVPGRFGVRMMPPETAETPFVSLFFGQSSATPSLCVLRRTVYEATGGWDERIQSHSEDRDMRLRIALRSKVHFVPKKLVRRRVHSTSMSTSTSPRVREARKHDHGIFRQKWSAGHGLSADEKVRVREAWQFVECRLLPYLWIRWGIESFGRKNLFGAAWCYLNACKQMALGVVFVIRVRRSLAR